MGDEKKVRRNFSIDPKVDKLLDDYAEEWDCSRSQIVNRAVSEYTDTDKLTKLENMVEGLQEQVDDLSKQGTDTPSENSEAKEKDSDQNSSSGVSYDPHEEWSGYTDRYLATGPLALTDKRRQGKANRVYNLIELEHSAGDVVSESEVTEAMETILGDLSDYLDETYRGMVHSRMEGQGWHFHSLKGAWYRDEAIIRSNLEFKWSDEIAPVFIGPERPEDVFDAPVEEAERVCSNSEQFISQLKEHGFATEDQAKAAVANAQKYLDRKK